MMMMMIMMIRLLWMMIVRISDCEIVVVLDAPTWFLTSNCPHFHTHDSLHSICKSLEHDYRQQCQQPDYIIYHCVRLAVPRKTLPFKIILLRRLVLCDPHVSDRQAMLQQASSAPAPEKMPGAPQGPKLSLHRCP